MAVLDLMLLLILFSLKVINAKQMIFLFIGNLIVIWYFNRMFPDIPVANHFPTISMDDFATYGISEWILLSNYSGILKDSELFVSFLSGCFIPSVSMVGASFFYTMCFKWHGKIRWAAIAGLVNVGIFVVFPLIENRIFNGLVYRVNLPYVYFGFIAYIIGFLLGKSFLALKKKYKAIKQEEMIEYLSDIDEKGG